MNSQRLSTRLRQPGHDQTFRRSERSFISALQDILIDDLYRIEDHPRDLSKIIDGRYGVIPEASIEYLPTGRKMYFEVKKQGPAGNADERACKHHTVQFYRQIQAITGYQYHPFSTIMCENLATDDRYTVKHPFYFEPGHYFLWKDYALEPLADYLDEITEKWLAPVLDEPTQPTVPQ